MEQQFPSVFPLNGSDCFQVFLDRHHRKYGTLGNVSRLVIYLEQEPDVAAVEHKLKSNPYVTWMHSLRLKTSAFFRLPHWKVTNDKINVNHHPLFDGEIAAYDVIFNRNIDPINESSIQFDFVPLIGRWAFVLSWNHILMDARGAEILLSHIESGNEITFFTKTAFPDLPWKDRLKEITTVKNFLIPRVKDGIQLIRLKQQTEKNVFRVIAFSEKQTIQMDELADRHRTGVSKSSFYLAAIQRAFYQVTEKANLPSWVPVPQDQRKKGQTGPVMANQVSYLFYSLPGAQSSLDQNIVELRNQMMEQMRSRMPASYHIMMDSMRRFPAWLYRHLVARPTKGALASYLFSDTGSSLSDLDYFGGSKVNGAVHYPPSSACPGLTIIFMRFKNCQQIIFGHADTDAMNIKMDTFEQELKNNLLQH